MNVSNMVPLIPDTTLCMATIDLVRDTTPLFLFNHVMRTFAFAQSAGEAQSLEYDTEMLFLGCALHDLGLVDTYVREARFEVDGADAATEFLSRHGYSDAKISVIWDAIALHTTADIPQRKQPEIALLQLGAGIDVGIIPTSIIAEPILKEIISAYPREDFKESMLELMASLANKKPMNAMHTVLADVGRDCVHGFHVPSFTDIIRGSDFDS